MSVIQEKVEQTVARNVVNSALLSEDTVSVDSRFGKININKNKVIRFTGGLLGMEDKTMFCLANFPDSNYAQFKILQSLEDAALSFVVLPLDSTANGSVNFIEKSDFTTCLQTLGIEEKDAALLLVTSVHHIIGADEVKVSVNVRAPLVIDTKNYSGTQYIFQSNKYQIRQMLN